jgi:hypothetical protein
MQAMSFMGGGFGRPEKDAGVNDADVSAAEQQ